MPSTAQTRRDPQKGKKEFSKTKGFKGFTVIELMITVAVVAIITSLALPSYRSIIEKRRITSSAEQLTAFMSAAQMESVKLNQEVAIFCGNRDLSGYPEYSELPVPTAACEAMSDNQGLRALVFLNLPVDRYSESEKVQVIYDPGIKVDPPRVVFDPVRGMMAQDYIVPSPIIIQLTSPQGEYALNITMLATGRVTMCSDTLRASKIVPGYDACT